MLQKFEHVLVSRFSSFVGALTALATFAACQGPGAEAPGEYGLFSGQPAESCSEKLPSTTVYEQAAWLPGGACMPRVHTSPQGVSPRQILAPETAAVKLADGTEEVRARIWDGQEWKSRRVGVVKEYNYPCGQRGDFDAGYRTEYLFHGGRWAAVFSAKGLDGEMGVFYARQGADGEFGRLRKLAVPGTTLNYSPMLARGPEGRVAVIYTAGLGASYFGEEAADGSLEMRALDLASVGLPDSYVLTLFYTSAGEPVLWHWSATDDRVGTYVVTGLRDGRLSARRISQTLYRPVLPASGPGEVIHFASLQTDSHGEGEQRETTISLRGFSVPADQLASSSPLPRIWATVTGQSVSRQNFDYSVASETGGRTGFLVLEQHDSVSLIPIDGGEVKGAPERTGDFMVGSADELQPTINSWYQYHWQMAQFFYNACGQLSAVGPGEGTPPPAGQLQANPVVIAPLPGFWRK